MNAVMQKGPSEQRCELSDKIMSLYLKRHHKNTLAFSAHKRILLQSASNEKYGVCKNNISCTTRIRTCIARVL